MRVALNQSVCNDPLLINYLGRYEVTHDCLGLLYYSNLEIPRLKKTLPE